LNFQAKHRFRKLFFHNKYSMTQYSWQLCEVATTGLDTCSTAA
jgi:hypothetical protein